MRIIAKELVIAAVPVDRFRWADDRPGSCLSCEPGAGDRRSTIAHSGLLGTAAGGAEGWLPTAERFTIIAGEARFTVNGEERVVNAGETIVVPIGVRHAEANPGSFETEGVVELRPALHNAMTEMA
jgi:uncharacterized cupin superfamily protein